jgi:transcriptional regulator with XRE-family HTH domain
MIVGGVVGRPKRGALDPKLLDFRQRLGLTQEQVAERIGISAEMVRRHERGQSMPIAIYRAAYCALYEADDVQLGFRPAGPASTAIAVPDESSMSAEDVSSIMDRVRRLELASVGTSTLSLLDIAMDDFVQRYEVEGPKPLTNSLAKQRKTLDDLISNSGHPVERRRLYRLAGRTSGLLAYGAVNRGRFPLARALATEAWLLAEYAEDRDLQAWIRGTQSFCEYYAGDYSSAVELARDGMRYAGDGPQAVRLTINGEARALGKLGDLRGVHESVERAYRLSDANPTVPGVSSCVSFGGYSLARTASNAVTAYVDLGATADAARHADIAMPEFELSDSQWSQALIRIDLAKSMVLDPSGGDAEQGASLVREALTISSDKPIASVVQRSRDFVREAGRRWRNVDAVRELRDTVSSTQLN